MTWSPFDDLLADLDLAADRMAELAERLREESTSGPSALRLVVNADGPDEGSLDGNQD
jgi:hypothetical protein